MTTAAVVFSLLALYQPSAPDIFLALGPDNDSKQIHVWYDRPLFTNINPTVSVTPDNARHIEQLEKIRAGLVPHVTVVEWDDLDGRKEHNIPKVNRPHYRVGRYGSWHQFPDKAFIHPIWSMKYTQYVLDQWYMQERIEKWQEDHFQAMYQNYLWYINGSNMYLTEPYYDYAYDYTTIIDWFERHRHGMWPPVPVAAPKPHPTFLYRNPLDFNGTGE